MLKRLQFRLKFLSDSVKGMAKVPLAPPPPCCATGRYQMSVLATQVR